MADTQVADNIKSIVMELVEESFITNGVSALIRMLYAVTDSGCDMKSFDEGIWLIGNIVDDNAKRIDKLTSRLNKAVLEMRLQTAE